MSELRLTTAIDAEALEALVDLVASRVLEQLQATAPPVSPFMSIPEAADFLRCRRQRVDDLLSMGRLSRVKEGSRTLVRRSEVEALLRTDGRRGVAHALPTGSRSSMGSGVAA